MLVTNPTMRQSSRLFASAPVWHSWAEGAPSIWVVWGDGTRSAAGSAPSSSATTRITIPTPPPTTTRPPTPDPRRSSTCEGSMGEPGLKVTLEVPAIRGPGLRRPKSARFRAVSLDFPHPHRRFGPRYAPPRQRAAAAGPRGSARPGRHALGLVSRGRAERGAGYDRHVALPRAQDRKSVV